MQIRNQFVTYFYSSQLSFVNIKNILQHSLPTLFNVQILIGGQTQKKKTPNNLKSEIS